MGLGSWRFWALVLCFLLFSLLHRGCDAQVCSVPSSTATVWENEPAGTLVFTITAEQGVTFELLTNPGDFFRLQGANVEVNKPLDFETPPTEITITIQCVHPDQRLLRMDVLIAVQNVNDVAPVFAQSQYNLSIPELSKVDTPVDEVAATDVEGDLLFYYIEPENEYFKLQSVNTPMILVKKQMDYDVIQNVFFTLLAVDTRSPPPPNVNSLNATTTVTISIEDVDNRPPWFQPCKPMTVDSSTICLNPGYRGMVNLTEQTAGLLPLQPGPVYAVDGDRGRNEQIIYRIAGGNEAGLFALDNNTGNITMTKPADVVGPIVLTVLALQLLNPDQFARTSVTFEVVNKSQNPPQFEQQQYEGFVPLEAGPSSLVREDAALHRPLRLQATDADFFDGINPDVSYTVEDEGSSFSVTAEGFVLLKGEVAPGTVSFQVRAEDTTNGEFGTTTVSVQVLPGATTAMPSTAMPTTAMPSTAMPTTAMPSTDMPTTAMATTGVASVTAGVTATTSDPNSSVSMTTQSQEDTARTEADLVPPPAGQYRGSDMAALGASLAVLLLLCLVVIGLLLYRMKKGDAAWKKLSEASLFRSMLVRGSGIKEGVQYTNSGFQNDGDTSSVTSDLPSKGDLTLDRVAGGQAGEGSREAQAALGSAAARFDSVLLDASSLAESDQADSEKEVKPILTKERRMEEGYKSVWFKEDIDPNAKEEVRIIPDSGERDAEEEEDVDEEESVDEEEASPPASPSALQTTEINGAEDSEEEGDVDL